MRQDHRLELGQAKAAVSQAGLERVGADGRPAVDDREYVPAEQVGVITDGQVQLELPAEHVERLDEHEPRPA